MLIDLILSFITLYLAYALRFNFEIPESFLSTFFYFYIPLATLKIFALWFFGVYRIPWRFFSLNAMERIAKAHIFAYLVFGLLYMLFGKLGTGYIFPRSAIFIDFSLSMLAIGLFRISRRVLEESKNREAKACVIVGANRAGELVARDLYRKDSQFLPLFFVDSDTNKIGQNIHNLTVVSFDDLKTLVPKHGIESAIIASDSVVESYEKLKAHQIYDIKVAKTLSNDKSSLETIEVEDLLARRPKDLDKKAISAFVSGKCVMITGAGGSIGSELAKSALDHGATKLILVENSEFALYKIAQELEGKNIVLKLVSVLDLIELERVFAEHKPQIVLHAAAYKHVTMTELNPKMAVQNNIVGTRIVADLAIKYGAENFVLISTDKAVRPTSIMGATKRVCELYTQSVDPKETIMCAVRFGNVLGSSGSVVPKFRDLIAKNRPLTVTHPEVTRYFMLVREAVDLVLQAAALAKGGEVFVLDMGKPVKIADLANKMLELAGRTELGIVYTGLKDGEKLYEELLVDESDKKTKYRSIFIAKEIGIDLLWLNDKIDKLIRSNSVAEELQTIVPEFNHFKEKR